MTIINTSPDRIIQLGYEGEDRAIALYLNINLYSINLATKTIGITRIGSDVIYSGEDRKKTIVSYIKND